MGGTSKSFNSVNLIGCRVAGKPVYTPAYMPANGGDMVRQKLTFTVYQNLRNDKTSKFKITVWGKLADICARSCGTGKELNISGRLNSFQGKVPMPGQVDGQPVQWVCDAAGNPITVEKVGVTVENIIFGADSDKLVAEEIQSGQRPQFWNVVGHADNIQWKTICQQRNATNYVNGNSAFGYAIVRMPHQGTVVDPNTQGAAAANTQAAPGFQGVAQTAPTQAAPAQQVVVNGQNMGYPVAPATQAPAQTAPAGGNSFAM